MFASTPPHTCTDCPQFTALHHAASRFRNDDKLHLKHLLADAFRCQGLVAVHSTNPSFERGFGNIDGEGDGIKTRGGGRRNGKNARRIILDYSRQQITGSVFELLFDLADRMGLTERMSELRGGCGVNVTEGRGVLHHVLRMPKNYSKSAVVFGGEARLDEVWDCLGRISEYSAKVRRGEVTGVTGKMFKNVVVLSSGGCHYATEAAYEALRCDKDAGASDDTKLIFIANVDPVEFDIQTRHLKAEETLFIIVSKRFEELETLYHARMARRWLKKSFMRQYKGATGPRLQDGEIVERHFCAVTYDIETASNVRKHLPQNSFD